MFYASVSSEAFHILACLCKSGGYRMMAKLHHIIKTLLPDYYWFHNHHIMFRCNSSKNWYLRATLWPSRTLISWEYLVMSGGSQRNSSSGMDQKYRPDRCWGVAHVSRSSSLLSLRSQSNSQLQWRGLPPNDSAKEERCIPDVARTWECIKKMWKLEQQHFYRQFHYVRSSLVSWMCGSLLHHKHKLLNNEN